MQLFPLIPTILTKISFLVLGIEILLIVLKKEAEAGGMATVVLVLFGRISTEFIRMVERKPGPISIGENKIQTVPRAAPPHQLKWKLDQWIFLKTFWQQSVLVNSDFCVLWSVDFAFITIVIGRLMIEWPSLNLNEFHRGNTIVKLLPSRPGIKCSYLHAWWCWFFLTYLSLLIWN